MYNAKLHGSLRVNGLDGFGKTLKPIDTGDKDILHAAEIIEHFDSKEELESTLRSENDAYSSFLVGFIFFIAAGVTTHILFYKYGYSHLAKPIRFGAIICAASFIGYFGYRIGNIILAIVFLVIAIGLVYLLGSFIWRHI
jgi:hypothetical protein